MTDKQMIIDGVDVAECGYFISEWDFNNCGHICKGTECKYKRLWYKKQLKRKEQECAELKQRLNQCWTVENSFVEQLDQLEAELKQEKTLKEMYFTYYKAKHSDIKGEFFKLKAENKELKEQLKKEIEASQKWYQLHTDEYFTKLKAKQTLTEIKEIAEKDKLACESCSERYTDGCTGYKDFENEGDCTHCGIGARANLAKQILQKISEVENENRN